MVQVSMISFKKTSETMASEKMYVRFKTIETISAHRLRDDEALQITGAESDIADRIVRDLRGMRITARKNRHDQAQSTSTKPTETTHRSSSRSGEANHTIRSAPTIFSTSNTDTHTI